VYLALARRYAGDDSIDARLSAFVGCDRELVNEPDAQLRFHSGPPTEIARA
jgi:tRNA isopentenyl-2-thiomethyl-A-37 hydroxylase MiaE